MKKQNQGVQMLFKYYPVTMLILGILLGVYVYSITEDHFIYTIPFTNLTYDMPIAVWAVVLIYLVFLISIVFIFSERLARFFEKNALNHDKNTLIKKIKSKMVEQNSIDYSFKTSTFKEINSIIDILNLSPMSNSLDCDNAEIKKVLTMFEDLKNGEEIDIYKFNIPQTSKVYALNMKNIIAKNYKNGLSIIKSKDQSYDVKKYAFIALLKNGSQKEIEKYKNEISFDKDIVFELLEVFISGNIDFPIKYISDVCKSAKFLSIDYLNFAKQSKGKLKPDEWISIFENLADNDEVAEDSYLYVLLELEMIESVKDRLKSQPIYEFMHVRAYLDLKDVSKSYPTDIFFKT